jgi:phage antirepressor YoqD-like protein
MTSIEIARLTEKEHFNVMRDIDKMFYSLEIDAFKFQGIFQDKSNRSQKCYKLDKELTLTLVSGYNVKLRQAIIRKWSELEGAQKPRTYEEIMREALLLADQKVMEQQQKIEKLEDKILDDKPKVSFANAVAGSATAVNVGEWVKTIQSELNMPMGRTKAFQWLREEGFIMKNSTMPYQHWVDKKIFEVKEVIVLTPRGDKITFTTLITGQGQLYLLDRLRTKSII